MKRGRAGTSDDGARRAARPFSRHDGSTREAAMEPNNQDGPCGEDFGGAMSAFEEAVRLDPWIPFETFGAGDAATWFG